MIINEKKEIVYVASDGKKFDTEKECNNYEDVCNAIKILDNYCIKTNCDKCPFLILVKVVVFL